MNPNAQFERDLEQWLQTEAPASAPVGLHASVMDRARTLRQRPGWTMSFPGRRFGRGRGMTLLAAAALLGGGALAAGSGILRLPTVVPPAPSVVAVTTTSPDATSPSPSGSAAPSASPMDVAGPGGVWIPVGSMGTPRSGHGAVRLLDGRMLVLGGSGGDFDPSTAEVYDPASGTWSPTGSMLNPMVLGPAVLLDGRVLVGDVLDGSNGNDDVYGSELYDPATGTWSATGDMIGSWGGPAVVLPDGRVLAKESVYDPASGTWTATGKMNRARWRAAATLLSDGKVLVAGGYVDVAEHATDSAEVYDPATGSWTEIAKMQAPHTVSMTTLLPDGKVLVMWPRGSEVYDPATGTWTAPAQLTAVGFPRVILSDGTVLSTGLDEPRCTAAALYDPRTASLTTASSMLRCAEGSSFTLLLDGTVLVAGGRDCNDEGQCISHGAAELYVPAGVALPRLPAFPNPGPPVFPSPTPVPTPLPPAAGPVPPNARSWTVTVDNRSSGPATLFVVGDGLDLVGSATPNVVPAGATAQVTFLFPPNDDGWIHVNLRPGDGGGGLVNADQIGIPGKILIREDGETGWLSP
jgi:hypothetical protein